MSADTEKESLHERIWLTAESLRESHYQEGMMSYWMGAEKDAGNAIGYQAAGRARTNAEADLNVPFAISMSCSEERKSGSWIWRSIQRRTIGHL